MTPSGIILTLDRLRKLQKALRKAAVTCGIEKKIASGDMLIASDLIDEVIKCTETYRLLIIDTESSPRSGTPHKR